MELTVKITPQVAAQVARRLRLAANTAAGTHPDIPAGPVGQVVPGGGGAAVSLVPDEGTGDASVR
jgi:hypothetical protein